jgi:hypothetical protein
LSWLSPIAVLCADTQTSSQCEHIRVNSATDILKVHNECVEVVQLLSCRNAGLGVETIKRDLCPVGEDEEGIIGFNHVVLFSLAIAMLRTEQATQFCAGGFVCGRGKDLN